MSVRSPGGWLYFYASGLVVTPLGDIWFERIDRGSFYDLFKEENYLIPTKNEVKTTNNDGDEMYVNMDSGFAWIQLTPGVDLGKPFSNGIMDDEASSQM